MVLERRTEVITAHVILYIQKLVLSEIVSVDFGYFKKLKLFHGEPMAKML